jgi:putative DNA primase/helicase
VTDFAAIMPAVAAELLGEPNTALSKAHDMRYGNHGSLSIDPENGRYYDHENNIGGGVIDLVKQKLGTDHDGAVMWLRNHGFLDAPKAQPKKIVATYPYVDCFGQPLFEVVRFEPKSFAQRRRENGDWVWNLKGVDRELYHLPEVQKAVRDGKTIYIVEGEKDADKLRSLGETATTNAGGAGKWLDSYNEGLRGANIVIIGDNDDAGRAHVEQVAGALTGIAKSVHVADLLSVWPECPSKGDISDFLAARHKLDELNPTPWLKQTERGNANKSDSEIARLAKLPPVEYEQQRQSAAATLGIRVTALDSLVKAKRSEHTKSQTSNKFLEHWTVEPWPDPVDGADLLNDLSKHLRRYVVLPEKGDTAAALWTLHTWVFQSFDITPYLAITSPARRCGKTVLMTLLYWLCWRGKKNDSMSKAAIYRSVEHDRPTLILDEVNWVVDQRDERQNILCGGFERNGHAEICEEIDGNYVPLLFSTYCPKAFGLIGKLTATLMDRAIDVSMQRKTIEKVERLRRRDSPDHVAFRQRCLRWAQDNAAALAGATPSLPSDLNDRVLDAWEPLFAIADHAGGDWPKRAREAAKVLSGGDAIGEERGVELLADVKAAFEVRAKDALTTKTLIAELCADQERPWATYNKGKPISDRQVAKLLRPFTIISDTVQTSETGEDKAKGYRRARFDDAFDRYLGPAHTPNPLGGGPGACKRANADETGTSEGFCERAESNLHGKENSNLSYSHAGLHACTLPDPPLSDMAYVNAGDDDPITDDDDPRHLTISTARTDLEAAYDELRLRGDPLPKVAGARVWINGQRVT